MTLESDTEVMYKVNAPYSQTDERAILWNDPALGIDWPNLGPVAITDKDRDASRLANYGSPFVYGE